MTVRDCADYCGSSPIAVDLAPGQSAPINRTTGQDATFSITAASGAHLGCLDLFFTSPEPGAQIRVSQARACPPPGRAPWQTAGLVAGALLLGLAPVGYLLLRRRS